MGLKKEEKDKTVIQQLDDITGNKDKSYFVRWFCKREKDREDFKEYNHKFLHDKEYETVMNWRFEPKVQKAIKFWKNLLYVDDMLAIYNKMVESALEGDVQAANWVKGFEKSEFFSDMESDFEKLMSGINVDDELGDADE